MAERGKPFCFWLYEEDFILSITRIVKSLCLLSGFMLVSVICYGAPPEGKPVLQLNTTPIAMSDYNEFTGDKDSDNYDIKASELKGIRAQVRTRIARALEAKMHQLEAQGNLPFTLKKSEEGFDLNRINLKKELVLIPFISMDDAFVSKYAIGKNDVRTKYVLVSGMNLAICVAESDKTFRMLGSVPLAGYKLINDGHDYSYAQLADMYADMTAQMIGEELAFLDPKDVKDLNAKKIRKPDTYQVENVNISSAKAQKIFADAAQREQVQIVLANLFTTQFQKNAKKVVYPPIVGVKNSKVSQHANEMLYEMQVATPNGQINVNWKKADNPINLDISGVAAVKVPEKQEVELYDDIAFKLWLNAKMNGKEIETTADTIMRDYMVKDFGVYMQYKDIYTELGIEAAMDLGKKMKP